MSSSGLGSDIFVFLFFVFSSFSLFLLGGLMGLLLVTGKSIIAKIFGVIVLIITIFSSLILLLSTGSVFEDESVKKEQDTEIQSSLKYDRIVRLYEAYSARTIGHDSYLYHLDDGTEIGLTKKQHNYVQEKSTDSEFRILYNEQILREYGSTPYDKNSQRGTPLIEAHYLEALE